MAVAVRNETIQRETAAGQSGVSPRARVRPRRRRRPRGLLRFAVPLLVMASFCYVGLYASVTALCYTRNRTAKLCRQQKIQNERLRLELIRRSSPEYIVFAAQKAGMVYATHYDYLRKPATVASAKGF